LNLDNISGVRVEKVPINHFATDRTAEVNLYQSCLSWLKNKKPGFVSASIPKIRHTATERTKRSKNQITFI